MNGLCPHPDNPLMAQAWADCLHWALLGDGEGPTAIRQAFEAETGKRLTPARSQFDRMIDEATSFDGGVEAYFLAFVPWFNENVWGDAEDEP